MGQGAGNETEDEGAAPVGIDPASIAERRFAVVLRGYDRGEVGLYLRKVAAAHFDALDRVNELEGLLDDALEVIEAPGPDAEETEVSEGPESEATPPAEPAPPSLEEEVAARFGDDLAEVVRLTRERVQAIEDNAARRADATLARAELDAGRIVQSAQARADHLLATEARLVERLGAARAELSAVLDALQAAPGSVDVIDLSDGSSAAREDLAGPAATAGRTGVATLAEPRVAEPAVDTGVSTDADEDLDLVGPPLEGEDDAVFDQMVRDALERAVRMRRVHPDQT